MNRLGDLNDSFIANEKRAEHLATQQQRDKLILDKINTDDRVPYSLQRGPSQEGYRANSFLNDERPVKLSRPNAGGPSQNIGKENQQRQNINIDESEDTFHNQDELARILARGEKLRKQMDQALEADDAWEALHGPHAVPKKYVPPFLSAKDEGNK